MQSPGAAAIRTQIQPSKPKREITNITNSQNTKRTYGQPGEQLLATQQKTCNRSINDVINIEFLAHLSRRLIGELIVYEGIRRPSVVRLSTFSNDISSEAVRPILFIFHI